MKTAIKALRQTDPEIRRLLTFDLIMLVIALYLGAVVIA